MIKEIISKKIISQQSKYEWIWHVSSYLSIARISLEKLKNDEYPNKSLEDKVMYGDKFILIAAIWSIKHAIELITKSLGIIIDKTYLQSHNCDELVEDLKIKLKQTGIHKYKPEKVDELAAIIDKYYRLEFWGKKLFTDKDILDDKNDIFRYPNDYVDVDFVNHVTVSEIDELLENIETLRRLRAIIDVQLQVAKSDQK